MLIKARIVLAVALLSGILGTLVNVNWNTFAGGTSWDEGNGIAVDGSGNLYVVGFSQSSWGAPVRLYSAGYDAFIAKYDSSGTRIWNTFLGGSAWDFGEAITLDGNGNIYVTGESTGSWGTPLRAYTGSDDVFVAKINSSGVLQWNTFLGGGGDDQGHDIVVDNNGNVYITGTSGNWGTPLRPFGGAAKDALIAKLNNTGSLQWHTFLGGGDLDDGYSIDMDSNGNIYVTGESAATWGTPVNAYNGCCYSDAFAAKLSNSGIIQWNTFLGGTTTDRGTGIVVDGINKVYLTGFSWATWGAPVTSFGGGLLPDAFVVKLDGSGNGIWNTFLGGAGSDSGESITTDENGNIYVTGLSDKTWGSPTNAFTNYYDAFVAKLNANGVRLQNTFLGGNGDDYGHDISASNGIARITGYSATTWGNPVATFTSGTDAFVAEVIVNAPIFSDVASSYWASQYIEILYNEGITGGCTAIPLQYCPENQVTRAQMAVFLLRGIHGASYTPPSVGANTGFGDVSTGYWAAAWIKQLASEGITSGCGNGNYCPDNPVTRAQMAVFLLKAKYGSGYIPPSVGASTGFVDVPTTHWAAAWIKQLATEGITGGCGGGTYCPDNPVTRAQMAVFLVKTFGLP